jgi:hypothetical protein
LTTQTIEQALAITILQAVQEQKPETTHQLICIVHDKLPNTTKQQILDTITKLQEQGKLQLTKQPTYTPTSLSAYLKTPNTTWYWTTLALTLASITAIFTIPEDLQPIVTVRYVLGTIFILWLPGYTFIKALFPQTPPPKPGTWLTRTVQNLDTIERIALSIGLSLALVPIVGLLLNYTPWGIRLAPITLSLTTLTLAFATAALLRENQTRKKQATPKTQP